MTAVSNDRTAPRDLGPIEVMVLAFPGSRFTGEIRPRIEELVSTGIIRVVDAVFIRKATDGAVDVLELADLADDPEATALSQALADQLDLLSGEDAEALVADLQPGSSALAIAFEHTWLKPVRDAVVAAGGVLLADLHIPSPAVDEVLAAVAAG